MTGPGKAALAALLFLLAVPSPGRGIDHRDALRSLPADRELLYLPATYAACIPCHPRPVFEDEDFNVDTHFRDTRLGKNLHWMHVFRQPQGTNCAACHRADADTGILGYPPEVGHRLRPDGGTCSPACHRTKEYRNAGRPPRRQALPDFREAPPGEHSAGVTAACRPRGPWRFSAPPPRHWRGR